MSIAQRLRFVPVIALIFISCLSAPAQQKEEEPRYRVVDGYAVHGYADGREIGYEWFETEDEAKAAKAKMEQVETTTGKYYDKVEIEPERRRIPLLRGEKTTRPPTDPSPTKGTKIEIKRPTFVDPGSLKKGKGSVLAGKKVVGNLGQYKVTIEFGKDGQFVISGEVQGKGKWSETDTGGVYMETERSTFRGYIKGDKVSGLWFTKDASRPPIEWSIELNAKPISDVVGTSWKYADYLSDASPKFDLKEGGKAVFRTSSSVYKKDVGYVSVPESYTGTWEEKSGAVTIKIGPVGNEDTLLFLIQGAREGGRINATFYKFYNVKTYKYDGSYKQVLEKFK